MQDVKAFVIVPVCSVASYLEQRLSSVQEQLFRGLEIYRA